MAVTTRTTTFLVWNPLNLHFCHCSWVAVAPKYAKVLKMLVSRSLSNKSFSNSLLQAVVCWTLQSLRQRRRRFLFRKMFLSQGVTTHFWGGIKQLKCMVILRGSLKIVHCLGWQYNEPCIPHVFFCKQFYGLKSENFTMVYMCWKGVMFWGGVCWFSRALFCVKKGLNEVDGSKWIKIIGQTWGVSFLFNGAAKEIFDQIPKKNIFDIFS